jgi:hypothetical protein
MLVLSLEMDLVYLQMHGHREGQTSEEGTQFRKVLKSSQQSGEHTLEHIELGLLDLWWCKLEQGC